MFAARRCRLASTRGDWASAEHRLRQLVDGQGDPGMIGRETVPVLARVLVRRGSDEAEAWLARAAERADRADVPEWLVPTALAHIEFAWLTRRDGLPPPDEHSRRARPRSTTDRVRAGRPGRSRPLRPA